MQMPNARQISEEQQDVFEDAPIDGSILVTGPPGTGKTVIAFLRAQVIAQRNDNAVVLMFNRVLRKYTENVASGMDGNINSNTLHSWLPHWWRKHQIERDSDASGAADDIRIYLDIGYSDRDRVKELGGRFDGSCKKWYVINSVFESSLDWRKFDDKKIIFLENTYPDRQQVKLNGAKYEPLKKSWWITSKQLNQGPNDFNKWLPSITSFDPPEIKKWEFHWEQMLETYLELDEKRYIDWGHLIIDEAQDFNPNMFKFLRLAAKKQKEGGLTILADENQRLQEGSNSSIDDIRSMLKIKKEREFSLTKNFRNTKQIAKVASYFYVGLDTGIPELPEKEGSIPKLITTSVDSEQISYIKSFLQYRGAQEVGVIVDSEPDRLYLVNKLKEEITNYKVQSYTSKNSKTSESLSFDTKGIITVLNRRSCKGLEFDTVFIPQLQNFSFSDSDLTAFKMNMYVICSRSRSELILLRTDCGRAQAPILEHIPSPESGLIEYQ
jgi:DNA helicase-2/ATP-dependent DNA helicase PcrA